MLRENNNLINRIDWGVVLLYFLLVSLGWLNIFAVVYDAQNPDMSIFDFSINSGKQLIWIATGGVLFFVIMLTDFRFYDSFAYFIYGGLILILLFVLFFGTEVAGSRSWFSIGSFRLQPSEFTKFATALAVAKFISSNNRVFDNLRSQLILFGIIGLPAVLIILQGDTGTAMVFSAFLVAFYREGFSPVLLGIGIAAAILFILTLFVPKLYLMIAVVVTAFLLIGINARKTKRIVMITASVVGVNQSDGFTRFLAHEDPLVGHAADLQLRIGVVFLPDEIRFEQAHHAALPRQGADQSRC